MPHTEDALYSQVVAINLEAQHHRQLRSAYGYAAILDVDVVELCLRARASFEPPIRVLDIGCGDGYAMSQLPTSLSRAGADMADFELWGMGLNRYDEMYLDAHRFIESGLNAYQPDGTRFHLVLSVFTFHYMWHKLEGIEKVYNDLLVDGGQAYLHFPGYLVRFDESPASVAQTEVAGNQQFSEFLDERGNAADVIPMNYDLVTQLSDDDDRAHLADFGRLSFQRSVNRPLDFGLSLTAFALFENGFRFTRMNDKLTYVASHYQRVTTGRTYPAEPCRITCASTEIARGAFELGVAVHAHPSERVILMCPGACEPLRGKLIDPVPIANKIIEAGLGAVVRYSDPYDHQGDYPELAKACFRRVMRFIRERADRFCSTATPRVDVMAYSSSGGAAAALVAEYDEVDSLLLVAPSFDVPRDMVAPGLERFKGRMRVLIGSTDDVVLPQQAFWFHATAENASDREYVEVSSCGHYFEGRFNRATLHQAPLWAFGTSRPVGFPPAQARYSMTE